MKHFRIRKNDMVQILVGKDKDKLGTVTKVLRKKDRVVVEGVNVCVRHTKPNPQLQQPGGRIEVAMPVHISNVAFYCPHCKKGVRVGYRFAETVRGGETVMKKVRFCKKCNQNIDQGGK